MNDMSMTGSEILVACEKVSTEAEVTGIKLCYKNLEFSPSCSIPASGERIGWGLRMSRNGKLGASGEWGMIDPFRLVDKVIGSCRYGPLATFSFPEDSPESDGSAQDHLEAMTHGAVHDYLKVLQERITEAHPMAALSASIQWGENTFSIMNSCGLSGSYTKSVASSNFSVTLPTDSGLLRSGYFLNTSDSLPAMDRVIEMLGLPIYPGKLDSITTAGKKNVVFSPVAFSLLLQALRAGVSGKLLAEGASPLAGMEGKQVLGNLLTIRDLPGLINGAASAPFDSEGTPTRDKIIFGNGVFNGFLHDLGTAAECGAESTGSSGRNLGEHSKPVFTNLTVDPCDDGSLDTLDETGSGILVTSILSAGGSRNNAASGSFAFDCGRVYLFRRGEIQGYYDGCILTGNVYDALSKINCIGSRQYRVGTNLLPFISLADISVG